MAFDKNIYEIRSTKIEGKKIYECVLDSVRDIYRARQKVLAEYLTCFTDTSDRLGPDSEKQVIEKGHFFFLVNSINI